MIGEATTGELSPTGIDGDDFDISSLRGEDFSSDIGDIGEEVNADTDEAASSFDLVAVASGEEKLDTAMSDTSSQDNSETLTPVNPELCEKFGTIACVGCIFAQDCQRRQAAMMASNNEDQPEQLSTLEQLLQEDEDEEPGKIVWAQPTPDDDVSREQLLAVNEEQSLIDDSPSIFKSESEPEPKPKPEQPLSDTQPSPRLSNKQKEAAAALPQATDDGNANLEANSNLSAKASKEPLAQIYSDNTNERIRQDELLRAVDHVADDSDKLVNREAATVNRVAQTTQRSNKHADQEVLSAVNTTEQISSVNTHQAIKIPKPEGNGSAVAATHYQKEPAIEKVLIMPMDANDTLADNETSAVVDREDGTQERPSPKSKSISAENNNLLKKTTPKNITTRPNSDSSTDFEVSAEMSLEAKKNPSIDKQRIVLALLPRLNLLIIPEKLCQKLDW